MSVALADGVESVHVTDGRTSFLCDARICMPCGAVLPVGVANDEPEAVQIELLAAYLVRPDGFVHVAHREYHDREEADEFYNYSFRDDCIGCWAELLRDEIVDHEARDAKRGAR
jgi:hypothetical protein